MGLWRGWVGPGSPVAAGQRCLLLRAGAQPHIKPPAEVERRRIPTRRLPSPTPSAGLPRRPHLLRLPRHLPPPVKPVPVEPIEPCEGRVCTALACPPCVGQGLKPVKDFCTCACSCAPLPVEAAP